MRILLALIPEMVLLAGAGFLFLVEPFIRREKKYFVSTFAFLVGLLFMLLSIYSLPEQTVWMESFFVFSKITQLAKFFLGGVLVFTIVLWTPEKHEGFRFDSFPMLMTATVGLSLFLSSAHFLTLVISLELLSICLYLLIGSARDRRSLEAAMKYFITGSVAAAFLLFGASLLYPYAKGLSLEALASSRIQGLGWIGMAFITAGIFFKVSAAPFHFWAPDVYEGSPPALAGFMAVAVKISGVVVILNFLSILPKTALPAFRNFMIFIAVLTLLVSNMVALFQNNIKRMLAYSSVSHLGFILIGVLVLPTGGVPPVAIFFYFLTYLLMTGGAFCFLDITRTETLEDVAGMIVKHPVLTGCMTLFMVSLTGLPPTMGFAAKFFIFMDVIRFRGFHDGYLIFVGIFMSVVSAYYYLNVVKHMFFKPIAGTESLRNTLDPCRVKRILIGICFVGVILFGLFPGILSRILSLFLAEGIPFL